MIEKCLDVLCLSLPGVPDFQLQYVTWSVPPPHAQQRKLKQDQ